MGISKLNPSAGGIPYGDNAGRPANPGVGRLYSNGQENRLEIYTQSVGWQNIVAETPGVVSVSGSYLESAGSGTIEIVGTNFTTGAVASVIGTNGIEINANSTTVNSIVSVSAVFTGLVSANEPYDVKVTNTSNLFGLLPDAVYVNNILNWQTAAGSLGTFNEQVAISVSATATDDSTITYALASGSTLPSGITLNSDSGLISGTLPDVATNTTYTFTINASDNSNPVVARTFSITSTARNAEVLLIGGGGAGGLVYASAYALSPAMTLLITVGAGGAQKADGSNLSGNAGDPSYFGSIIAAGGGGGVGWGDDLSTRNGGNGGGGGGENTGGTQTQTTLNSGVAGILQYGNNGGNAGPWSTPYYTGGGGGGAGAAGANFTGNGTAPGGIGREYSITGTSLYYAGGGGGGTEHTINANTPDSPGGLGGGGTGRGYASNLRGGDGTDGLGGGGGSGSYGGPGGMAGGKGGNGVVIIAYPNTFPALTTIPGTLTYDQPTRSGYRVYRFTSGSGTVTF